MKNIIKSRFFRRIVGIILIIIFFLLAKWIDNLFQVGTKISGIKEFLFFHGEWLIIPFLVIGMAFILWDTKFVQKGFKD